MKHFVAAALTLSVALFGTTLPASAAERGPDARPDASRYAGLLYVSDVFAQGVFVCPTGNLRVGFQPPTAQLEGVSTPTQLAIDSSGTVYVANGQIDTSGDGSVAVFPRGQLSPSRTLTSGLNTATGVAVDANDNVYVSNKYLGTVSVFTSGGSQPSETIAGGGLKGPDGLAVDRENDLFIADSSAIAVFEVPAGSTTPKMLTLKGLTRPVGVAVDSRGTLYVSNLNAQSSNVVVFAPGASSPERTLTIPYAPGNSGIGEAMGLSIGPGDMLIVSAFIALFPVDGEWFAGDAVVAGFAPGGSQPEWYGYGISAGSAVFQSKQ